MSEDAAAARSESIGWLELFFDLVVVAAVAVLTEGVREEPTWSGVGLAVVLYAAIWTAWSSTVLYANVAADQTRLRVMSVAMLLVAVMTASAPVHDESRADVFVVALLVLRSIVGRSALLTGRVLDSWPLLQFGGMTVIWVASIWVPVPAKYWVWAAALVLELFFVAGRAQGRSAEIDVAAVQARLSVAGVGATRSHR